MKFERFDDYWGGKPYLDGIQVDFIADPLTQMAAFLAGEHHIIADVNPKDAKDLESRGDYKFSTVPGQYQCLHGDGAHEDSPWSKVKVRQAMAYAINRDAIAEAVGYGYWTLTPRNQVAIPGGWCDNPDVKGYPYDPEKAKQLLAEAGYPDGFETTMYTLNAPQYVVDYKTAVQGMLRKVGIIAEMDICDAGRYHEMTVGGHWYNGIHGVAYTRRLEVTLAGGMYSPTSIFCQDVARPPEYTDLLAKALAEPDLDKMTSMMLDLQKLDVDKYCMNSWLFLTNYISVKSSKVHDDGFMELSGVHWQPAKAWLSK